MPHWLCSNTMLELETEGAIRDLQNLVSLQMIDLSSSC